MKRILIVGTGDTKSPEMLCIKKSVEESSCVPMTMDVGVIGDPEFTVDITRHDVCGAVEKTIDDLIALGSENDAMTLMAEGASKLTLDLYNKNELDGVIILGGTMGTDLALDVANVLPLGVPKLVLSTVSFSHMIPPHRLAPDLTMMLWAGGLYGLNSICESTLRQAAGAVCGAAKLSAVRSSDKPVVGITSFGKSCLKYMVDLVPALEARGFEAAVFHATGMGGRAFEALASQGKFAAVMDFAIQEVTNDYFGSVVTAGPDRLTNAGKRGIPQIVAPGALDLVDVPGWKEFPEKLRGREFHSHNRILSATVTTAEERALLAGIICDRLSQAKGPTKFILPTQGIHEWDRVGGELRDDAAIASMNESFRKNIRSPAELVEIDAHINDRAFSDLALKEFDLWLETGVVNWPTGQTRSDTESSFVSKIKGIFAG
jgi:uncharacterized protein (UPF0261 family)